MENIKVVKVKNFKEAFECKEKFEAFVALCRYNIRYNKIMPLIEFDLNKKEDSYLYKSLCNYMNMSNYKNSYIQELCNHLIIVINIDISDDYNDNNFMQYKIIDHHYNDDNDNDIYVKHKNFNNCTINNNNQIHFSKLNSLENTIFENCFVILHLFDEKLYFKLSNSNRFSSLISLDEKGCVFVEFVTKFNKRWKTFYKNEINKYKENKKVRLENLKKHKEFCNRFYYDKLYRLPSEYSEYSENTSWCNEDYKWVYDPQ